MSAFELKPNQIGIVKEIQHSGVQRMRMLDLGFVPNSEIKCAYRNNSLIAFTVKNSLMAIRNDDAKKIIIQT
jgi:Fe2+ transport system protein FeoA